VGAAVNTAAQEIGALVPVTPASISRHRFPAVPPQLADRRRPLGTASPAPLLADPAFCRRLAASGCAMLQLGLESADQQVLDALGKGTRLDQIDCALGNLAEARIGVFLYVLFGTPAEHRDAALRTRDFVASHADRIDFINVALFNLPTASAEAPRLATRTFYEGDLSLYREFTHPSGWNRDAVRAFVAEEFDPEPAIKAILARTPPVFTSNHAPFFLLATKSDGARAPKQGAS
jgi:hypothetical protein